MANELEWSADEAPGSSSPGVDLKRVLWGRKWLLLFFAAVGAAIGYLQFTKEPPLYMSNARVLVVRQLPKMQLQSIGTAMPINDPLDTHVELIRTPLILNAAIEKGKLTSHNASSLALSLMVLRNEDSPEILELSYTSADKKECPIVLNAVIQAYMDWISESQQNTNEKIVEFMTRAKDELTKELAEHEVEYQRFRDSATLLFNGDKTVNIPHTRLAGIENERSGLMLEQGKLRAELDSFEIALSTPGANREMLLLLAQKFGIQEDENGKAVSTTNPFGQLIPLMVDVELKRATLGNKHPQVVSLEKQIEITRSFIQKQSGEVANLNAPPPDLLTLYMDTLRQQIRTNDEKLRILDESYAKEEEEARKLSSEENKNRELVRARENTESLFTETVQQLSEMNLVKDSEALSAQPIVMPGEAYQVHPKINTFLSIGAVLGGLIGIGLSFLLETTDRSFRSPEDISRQLRLPVVGHVPRLDLERGARVVKDKILDKSLATYHRPKSRVAEAFRGVRTALLFGAKSKNLKVVQITSPDPGDGKSTLSANTAIALANSGKRVLLIDADLRKPKQHRLFGLQRDTGVSSVLAQDMDLIDAVKQVPVPNLDILTAGPKSDQPGELILDPKFEQMLELARERYDFVVIDSPPVLAVTDGSAIAPLADGVILVFRISKRSRPHASQARETLEMIGAKMIGVVVNGLSDQVQYGYSYGGGSSLGSGMHYGYGARYYYGADDYYETGSQSSNTPAPKVAAERRRIDNGA